MKMSKQVISLNYDPFRFKETSRTGADSVSLWHSSNNPILVTRILYDYGKLALKTPSLVKFIQWDIIFGSQSDA